MKQSAFETLEEALADPHYPEVDLALRRGRHIGRVDGTQYEYLVDAQILLEVLYRRYGCELIQQSDGYFYLLPSGDKLGRRQLSAGEMLVGQTLALLYLDPATLQHGGVLARPTLLQRLAALLGTEVLVRTLEMRGGRRRKFDERLAAEIVRTKVAEALRRLADLGFVDLVDADRLRLRPALMRFAEPVRGLGDRSAALARLVRCGEVAVADAEGDAGLDADVDADAGTDPDTAIRADGDDDTYLETDADADAGAGAGADAGADADADADAGQQK